MSPPVDRVRYAGRAARAIAASPYEGVERTLEHAAEWTETRTARWQYRATPGWEEAVHGFMDVPWPCSECEEFDALWSRVIAALRRQGLEVGRGAYGGWDDGDPGLARLAWCTTRHLRPEFVVETGVGRGVTTRIILEGLERNQAGRLWSIDLPPLLQREITGEVGAGVPADGRGRWTLLRGSSRRLLPGLIGGLPRVDLFLHDSSHTARNLRFELDQVLPKLSARAAILVDDVHRNRAFGSFSRDHPELASVVCMADDGDALFACLLSPLRGGDTWTVGPRSG
jgi:hypothetical protein